MQLLPSTTQRVVASARGRRQLRASIVRPLAPSNHLCAVSSALLGLPSHNAWNTADVKVLAPEPAARQLLRVQTHATSAESPLRGYTPPSAGFKVLRITGDGSCMFRAIVQGVQMHAKGTPMPTSSETTAALNLRSAVVQELRNRKEEMEPFIAGITDDWEGYLTRMAHPAAWGGEPEMVMAVNVIRRPITVYRPVSSGVEPIVTYGEELAKGGMQAVHLLWSGMHYDLLVPSEPPTDGAGSAPAA